MLSEGSAARFPESSKKKGATETGIKIPRRAGNKMLVRKRKDFLPFVAGFRFSDPRTHAHDHEQGMF